MSLPLSTYTVFRSIDIILQIITNAEMIQSKKIHLREFCKIRFSDIFYFLITTFLPRWCNWTFDPSFHFLKTTFNFVFLNNQKLYFIFNKFHFAVNFTSYPNLIFIKSLELKIHHQLINQCKKALLLTIIICDFFTFP